MFTPFDVESVPRDDLPRLLGQVTELEANIRLRLAEPVAASTPPVSRLLSPDEAAAVAGVSRAWILRHTAGLRFRRDLSRKQARFDESGLRVWLGSRGR